MTKRFKLFKTYYETTETTKIHKKLKYGQTSKKLKNIKNCLGMIFYGEISKNYPFDKKQASLTKIMSKCFNSLNCLLKNDKYGETAQKLKVG